MGKIIFTLATSAGIIYLLLDKVPSGSLAMLLIIQMACMMGPRRDKVLGVTLGLEIKSKLVGGLMHMKNRWLAWRHRSSEKISKKRHLLR